MTLHKLYIFCAVKSFTELGPQLLMVPGVNYLLSEVFSQDPLERYFSRQRHRDLKTMNVEAEDQHIDLQKVSKPLPKCPRKK